MMRLTILGVVLAYVVVAALELTFHWYAATQDTTIAHSLRDWYLYKVPGTHKHNSTYVDEMIPAIVLGLAVGCITAHRSKMELVWYILIFPLGVITLFPICAAFFPSHWLWSETSIERATTLGIGYSIELVLGGFFACYGRILTKYFQGRTPDE